jgi:outer membrane biosynthesis protein TonB
LIDAASVILQIDKAVRRITFIARRRQHREDSLMTRARNLLIATAVAALTATGAYAQTAQPMQPAMQPAQPQAMQAAPVTPQPQNLTAPAPTDPLVQKRNADAQANAEYRASKKASKAELKAENKQAKAQYKEQVRNAKVNRKADKDAAKAELNETATTTTSVPKEGGSSQ